MARFDYDDERLPEGLSIIGYSSDTNRYEAEDVDGSLWLSPPGTKFGEWRCIRGPTKAQASGSQSQAQSQLQDRPQDRPQSPDSQATGSDPRRFSQMFLDPGALANPDKASGRSSFSKMAKKAVGSVATGVKRMVSSRKKPNSGPPLKPEPRPGYEPIRLPTPTQDSRSQRRD